ncbi:DUF4832 domain-containing protein [Flavobacterium sp. CYK-4]|uniref:T9SS type A sorting domain-containing protein n=1 Tax=Flavobacterium lotistagni TaxID=2709660 RepID=UPI001409BD93|nr:DUF4832 domain-containing protein [Flavobacterium lotistagni]NHM06871.1 DUF4832 domain-containing protein [Flavobacterium lotistagni]
MKKQLTLLGSLLFAFGSAQTVNLTYTASSAVISNPERGFYKHTSTGSTLNQTSLTNYRLNNNITLIYRNFELNDFKTGPISAAYLTSMQSDFTKIRNAGIKCVIRFTYSSDTDDSPRDASKATILSHIAQLKPILLANADVIAVAQAGFIGTWGEWFYTDQAEFGGWGYNQTNLTQTNLDNRKEVVNAFLGALPLDRMIQLRKPAFKYDLYSTVPLTNSQAFNQSAIARLGHHNDCFLASSDDNGTYDNVTTEYPYLAQETKFLPMGGETCDLNAPRTDCTTALFEMNKFHWSYLNLDYYPDVIDGFQTQNCFVDVQKKLGYRFELKTATLPTSVALGSTLPIVLKIVNQGFASPFNERKAYIVLKNLTTNQVYPIQLNTDPRLWLGPNEITIAQNLTLPTNLTTGNYKMYLHLPDKAPTLAARPEYAIRFANDNMWESITGYNSLNHTLSVTSAALATIENAKLNMAIYPVPAKNEMSIELENIDDYTITLFNSIGQKINATVLSTALNKVTLSTSSLSDGLYFIDLSKGSIKDTRKFIVKH